MSWGKLYLQSELPLYPCIPVRSLSKDLRHCLRGNSLFKASYPCIPMVTPQVPCMVTHLQRTTTGFFGAVQDPRPRRSSVSEAPPQGNIHHSKPLRSPRYTPTPKCPYLRVTSRSPRYPHLSRTNGVPKTVPIRGRLTSEVWPRHLGSRPCGNFKAVSARLQWDTSCSRSFTRSSTVAPQWHHLGQNKWAEPRGPTPGASLCRS